MAETLPSTPEAQHEAMKRNIDAAREATRGTLDHSHLPRLGAKLPAQEVMGNAITGPSVGIIASTVSTPETFVANDRQKHADGSSVRLIATVESYQGDDPANATGEVKTQLTDAEGRKTNTTIPDPELARTLIGEAAQRVVARRVEKPSAVQEIFADPADQATPAETPVAPPQSDADKVDKIAA